MEVVIIDEIDVDDGVEYCSSFPQLNGSMSCYFDMNKISKETHSLIPQHMSHLTNLRDAMPLAKHRRT